MLTETTHITTTCCIAGGGPAAIMTGFLLARAGVDVVVLEKHNDFLRDFRGDTIHPSTFELMHELGLLDEFLEIPHQEIAQIGAQFNDKFVTIADFSYLPVAKPRLGIMPQWNFLNFIKQKAQAYPSFNMRMNAKVTDLLREDNRVTGAIAETQDGALHVHALLVIGADGRSSTVRKKAGLQVISSGAPIDVIWFRLTKHESSPNQTVGRFYYGKMLVLIDRGDHYQCGYVIAKGQYEKIKERGLQSFKDDVADMAAFLKSSVKDLRSWDDTSMLSVAVDHLKTWYDEGVLCIGDAAHAMSPVGGVGINLAIQDAVATANILFEALLCKKNIETSLLKKVQQRRAFPARMVQKMQIGVHKGLIEKRIGSSENLQPPLILRLINKFAYLRRIPARLVGMGIRREHIQTPEHHV